VSIIQGILAEFNTENVNTRKMLERVPEAKLGWKPHEKSMTFGRLAAHIAEIPCWIGPILKLDELVFDPETFKPTEFKTVAELLVEFDRRILEAEDTMRNQSDDHLMQTWRLRSKDHVFFEMPRVAVLRGMILNHSVHHRGQLSVYLRLNDVPLPAIYGPSADDPGRQ
jgi:uncharacterized damage-inducible protein DinB